MNPLERFFFCGEEDSPVSILTAKDFLFLSLPSLIFTLTASSQTSLFYLPSPHPSLFTRHTPPFGLLMSDSLFSLSTFPSCATPPLLPPLPISQQLLLFHEANAILFALNCPFSCLQSIKLLGHGHKNEQTPTLHAFL